MARIAGVPSRRAGLLVRFAYRLAARMFHEFALGRARRVDARLKALAELKAAALVGCPF